MNIIFWKRKIYRNREQVIVCQELPVGDEYKAAARGKFRGDKSIVYHDFGGGKNNLFHFSMPIKLYITDLIS